MSTRWCPSCGSEYVPSVQRCLDCDVELVDADEEPEGAGGHDGAAATDDGARGEEAGSAEVTYELHDWSHEARAMLEQLLAGSGIVRAWSGTTLAVDGSDEARVDELIDEVDTTIGAALDPDAERTVYEVNEWTMDQLGVLTSALGEAAIPYEFDIEGDLAVLAEDEERVEALLDSLDFGPVDSAMEDGDPDDGLETAEILSDLFVACDRLHNNPRDADGILGAVAAADRIEGRSLPFGYEPRVWNGLIERSLRLKSMLEDDEVPDDLITEDATDLRSLLRQYV